MLVRVVAITLVSSASQGCYRDSDAFISRVAKLSCVNARECENEAYEANFGSMRECRDAAEAELHEAFEPLEDAGCEYIADNGRDCIHAIYKVRKECNADFDTEIADACDAVFACPADAGRVGVFPIGGRELIERAAQPDDE